MTTPNTPFKRRPDESGNVILFVLLAIVLIGLVTAALRATGISEANIDDEQLAIKASEVMQYTQELSRGVNAIVYGGTSQDDVRFAHPSANAAYGNMATSPENQVFSTSGGNVEYRTAPTGINDGSAWEFYGTTHIPGVGTTRGDLIAVLPNVTESFCDYINRQKGQTSDPAEAAPNCLHDGTLRFSSTTQYDDATTNMLDDATFTTVPAMQACVDCDLTTDKELHFYHVLIAR